MPRRAVVLALAWATSLIIASGGGAIAATAVAPNPIKLIKARIFTTAAIRDANGNITTTGWGYANATCPKGYIAIGGGPIGLLADGGSIVPTTSTQSGTNPRQWLVAVDNYSDRRQIVYSSATCAKASAM